MPFPALPSQINCPQCNTRFVVNVHTIVDVAQEPELKEQFLAGQLNQALCPNCGAGGMLSTALVYHDPDKELLITYVPAEMGLGADDQEKLVGSLVKAVMDSVPQENRKGYFLQPKTALTYESLYDAVLIGEGYTQEQLDAQRERLQLIQTLLTNVDDDETLESLIKEHKETLDYAFLLMLSSVIEDYQAHGQEEGAKQLETLREKLVDHIDLSSAPAAAAQPPQASSYDELITMLREAEDESARQGVVAMNRAQLDYGFFQALTAQIDDAQTAEDQTTVDELTALREAILTDLDNIERLTREAQDKASLLIMRLTEAEDIEVEVREHIGEINEMTLSMLLRLTDTARNQEDQERAEKFDSVLAAITTVLEERLPPAVRLINQLARAEYPDGTNTVLEENRGLLNQELLDQVDGYLEQMKDREEEAEMLAHLTEVRGQIAAKLTILRG